MEETEGELTFPEIEGYIQKHNRIGENCTKDRCYCKKCPSEEDIMRTWLRKKEHEYRVQMEEQFRDLVWK